MLKLLCEYADEYVCTERDGEVYPKIIGMMFA